MPVTTVNMNYVSIVVIGLVSFVTGLWFTSKKGNFKGPRIDMAQLTERRMAAMNGEIFAQGIEEDAESLETKVQKKA